MEKHRIKYYWPTDLSFGYCIDQIKKYFAEIFYSFDKNNINDCLEVVNIIKFYEHEEVFKDDKDIMDFKPRLNTLKNNAYVFLNNLSDSNFLDVLNILHEDNIYLDDFWDCFNNLKIFDKISEPIFIQWLEKYQNDAYYVFLYKKIVDKYSLVLKNFLLNYSNSCVLLFNNQIKNKRNLYFPENISETDINIIIEKYIDWNSANFQILTNIINYPKLLEKYTISPQNKVNAERILHKQQEIFFSSSNNFVEFKQSVWIVDNQIEPIIFENEGINMSIQYSKKFLKNFDYIYDPLNVFRVAFWFLNPGKLISFTSKDNDLWFWEKYLEVEHNQYYKNSFVFKNQDSISFRQMILLDNFLKSEYQLSIEKILENHLKNFLWKLDWKNSFKFDFSFYEHEWDYKKKLKEIFPEIDSLIKQIFYFIKYSTLDFDAIKYLGVISYEDLTSFLKKKNFYLNWSNQLIKKIMYLFFSDQSGIFYIDGFEDKYNSFYDLIYQEKLTLENFHDYQKLRIQELIKYNYIWINKEWYLEISDIELIFILKELYYYWEINILAYCQSIREKIIEQEKNGLFKSDSKLLSKKEIDYINFYLNDKFKNWPAIRNCIIHGTPLEEQKLQYYYYTSIKILILLLLKFEDDYSSYCKTNSSL